MKRLLLACALGLASIPTAWAGWDEGAAAYARKDWATAIREFQPLAVNGHVGAMSMLGHLTLNGVGIAKNEAEGMRLITAAAEKGEARAQNTLGGAYFLGRGMPRDIDRALIWLSRAAAQNQPNALNNLGQMYFVGNGLTKDEAKALDYLRRAADQGITSSWETIGIAYWHGRGVAQNRTEAVRWLKKAAERGHMVAQNIYGAALWTGDGIAADRAQAIKWFEASGNQGDGPSLFNTGQAFQFGNGVAKDIERAYYYLILAERQAKPADKQRFAQARDAAKAQTSPDQENRAQQRAAAWRPLKTVPNDQDPGTISTASKPADTAPPRPQRTTGSGFVVSQDGSVLTNSHVVRDCRNIRVTLEGQPPQVASLLQRDADNDMAVLKTTLQPTDVARFREDKPMRSGDGVVAIGYPLSNLLSREPNVTAGVVSALAGLRGDKRHYQVTAPIQNGNSGGPLADMSGNIVGIVTATLRANANSDRVLQNVNFAIKSDLARKFLSDSNVAFGTAPATATLSPADVGDKVRKVTVFVECEG
jgi:TPR repeat protein